MVDSTSGSSCSASCRVKNRGIRKLDAGNLDGQRPASGAIKFREDDALPGTQEHRGIPHLQTECLAHQHAAEVRISVPSVTIGMFGIIVPVILLAENHLLEKRLDVVDQRILPLIDEHGGGGVERLK